MKQHLLFLLVCCFFIGTTYPQKRKPKPVKIVAANEFARDSSFYTIERIQLKEFRNILEKNPTLVIQFFQPWCGGVTDWIEQFVPFYSFWEKRDVPFLIIFDNKTEEFDFFVSDTSVGRVVFFFNKYSIPYKTYIISKDEQLLDYQRLLADYKGKKKLKDHFVYVFKNGKILYSGYTKQGFKRARIKWKNTERKSM